MLHHFRFFLLISIVVFTACQSETTTVQTTNGKVEVPTDELLAIMGEVYLYGYPLVLMDITKDVTTNIKSPHLTKPLAPINQLGHFRTFPDHNLTAVVKPNVDTYYSIAWMDLEKEPLVLYMPATERYYLLPMLDAYSNVFTSPGTRTTGTAAQVFFITGPKWDGEIPEGMTAIESPTDMVWLLGRIQVNSPEDGATVVKGIQDSMKLIPFSALGNDNYIPQEGKENIVFKDVIPVQAVRELSVNEYFNKMSELMVDNPPKDADSIIVRKMAKIGLIAGQPFHVSSDNLILRTKLKAMPNYIHKKFEERRANPDTSLMTNGWMMVKEDIGTYGTDYKRRAFIDFVGLGACIPEDAIYPNCSLDINGDPLDSKKKYTIHFEKEQIPPVNAFWSLTAYNSDEFLVKNDLNRFALGDRDDLFFNEDGSLDIYIQTDAPEAENEMKNWLPIPVEGAFYLTMRLYWAKEIVFNGEWKLPYLIPDE